MVEVAEVRRRFREFVLLHESLKHFYAGYFIPARAAKDFTAAQRRRENFIGDRIRELEKYLQQLQHHPVLQHSKVGGSF